ncbi:MAG: quinone oxidoreductase [Methylotenera sp.]
MAKGVRFYEVGGPEVLRYETIETPPLQAHEARILQLAIGLNFIDTYQRSGLYKVPLPSLLGSEGAGVVEEVGNAVTNLKSGDRVAYAGGALGAYAEVRNIQADRLCKLPDSISFEHGAAMMLKGMTVQYLIRRTYPVQAGDTVLFHAASGGVGLIACQWLKALDVSVIGTAGTDEKCALAKQHGADHCVNYRTENFVERVKEITNGKGVPVVYDSVGKDTFAGSLDCLSPLGLMVCFGNASGAVPPFEPNLLSQKGSLFLTRPTLFHYIATRPELEKTSNDLFDVVQSGKVEIEVAHRYELQNADQAHRDLESRKNTGASILIP